MKKVVLMSFAAMLLSALPAQAQLFRKHQVVQQVIASPIVHQLLGVAASQLLPNSNLGNLDLSSLTTPKNTKITVDRSVTTNLNATKANLRDADARIQKLMEKNGIKKSSSTGSGGTGSDDDPVLDDR